MAIFSSLDWHNTRITTQLDFTSPGKRSADLRLKYSDNKTPLGYIPIPAGVIIGRPGPTVLLSAGVHGDEYEGQVSLRKLFAQLDPDTVHGRIIILPSLNMPAVQASSRISPLDQGNLNRAFPGDADGSPTAAIANLLETVILPACDAAIDLHSGGKAAWFLPFTMAGRDQQGQLSTDNIELAKAFDLPHLLLMNAHNDNRTVNAAACRQNVTMIAVELGGGGKITPSVLAATEHGVENCLKHLGLIEQSPKYMNRPISLEVNHDKQSIYALQGGLFEPTFSAGDSVDQRQIAGYIYSLNDLDQPVSTVRFTASGIALMCCNRGLVERGELLSIVAEEAISILKRVASPMSLS